MNDIIRKQALLETIKPMVGMWEEGDFWINYKRVVDIIENFPPAELERKKGEWIVHLYELGRERYECSECTGRCDLGYNFCPNCGAEMRSKE